MALFAFGHMHERLQKGAGNRRMVSVDVESGTVFLNAAVVPRWQSVSACGGCAAAAATQMASRGETRKGDPTGNRKKTLP